MPTVIIITSILYQTCNETEKSSCVKWIVFWKFWTNKNFNTNSELTFIENFSLSRMQMNSDLIFIYFFFSYRFPIFFMFFHVESFLLFNGSIPYMNFMIWCLAERTRKNKIIIAQSSSFDSPVYISQFHSLLLNVLYHQMRVVHQHFTNIFSSIM